VTKLIATVVTYYWESNWLEFRPRYAEKYKEGKIIYFKGVISKMGSLG
jgi:hypothetical protein